MSDTRVVLSVPWAGTMLIHLSGDVLRIIAADVEFGKTGGVQRTQAMWLAIAAVMLVPIVMVLLSLTVPYAAVRWANIVVAEVTVPVRGCRPSCG